MAGDPQSMKSVIAQLEKSLKPPGGAAAAAGGSRPKPTVQHSPSAPSVKPLKPLVSSNKPTSPSPAAAAAAGVVGVKPALQTNGAPKWPPVNTTPTTQSSNNKSSVDTAAVSRSASAAAVGVKIPGVGNTDSSSSSPRQPAVGRKPGPTTGVKVPPTAPTKPPTAARSAGTSSVERSTSVDAQSQQQDDSTPPPPWVALMRKRNSSAVENSHDSNNNNSSTGVTASSNSSSSKSSSGPSELESALAKKRINQTLAAETGVSAAVTSSPPVTLPKSRSNSTSCSKDSTACDNSPHPQTTAAVSVAGRSASVQSVNSNSSKDSTSSVVVVGTKTYRLIVFVDSTAGQPAPRKPAKPPSIDLSRFRQLSDDDDDGEIYDDVQTAIDSSDILRHQRQRPESTVSRISEYTEEEELRALQQHQQLEHGDEIYDDISQAPAGTDDEIYQELD